MVKMKAHSKKGIDIFIDAVSIPGESMQYVLRGSIERGGDLWSPGREAYDMLKGTVTAGPRLVFTWYHEAEETKIQNPPDGESQGVPEDPLV